MEFTKHSITEFTLPEAINWRDGVKELLSINWNSGQTQWQAFWWENWLFTDGLKEHEFFDLDAGEYFIDAKSHRLGTSKTIYLNDVLKTWIYAREKPVHYTILIHDSDIEIGGINYQEHRINNGKSPISGKQPKPFHVNVYPKYVLNCIVNPDDWQTLPRLGQGHNSNGAARREKFGLELPI